MAEIQYQNYEIRYTPKSREYNDNHETIDYNDFHKLLKENKKNELLENTGLNNFDKNLDEVYSQNNNSEIKKFKIKDLPLEDNSDLFAGFIKIGGVGAVILGKYSQKIYDYIKNIFVKSEKVAKVEKQVLKGEKINIGKVRDETVGGTYSSEKRKIFLKELDKIGVGTKEKLNYEILLDNKIETASLKLVNKGKLIENDKIIINGIEFTAENGKNGLFDIFSKLDGTKRKEILEALDKSGRDKKIYTILSLDNLKYGMEDVLQKGSLSQAKILFRGNNIGNLDKKVLLEISKDRLGKRKLDEILSMYDEMIEKSNGDKVLLKDILDGLYQLNKSVIDKSLFRDVNKKITNIDNIIGDNK